MKCASNGACWCDRSSRCEAGPSSCVPDTLRIQRWTTPISDYRDFSGWHSASEGDAIWHRPIQPFTYGHFSPTQTHRRE